MRASAQPAVAIPLPFLVLLSGLAALGPFTIDMYLPALPALQDHFATTPAMVQGTLSAYFVGLAVGQLAYGPIVDRFGRRAPLLVGLAIYVVASLGCMVAPSIEALLGLRFAQALGGCAGMVVSRAVLRDLYGPQQMARVLSMILLVMGIAPIVAPMVGTALHEAFGWPLLFAVLALYAVVLAFAVYRGLPETLHGRGEPLHVPTLARTWASILRSRRFVGYTLAGSLAQAGLFAYIASSSFVFVDVYGLSTTAYAALFGLNATGLIAASQLNAVLLRRWSPSEILPATLGLYAAAGALMVVTVGLGIGGVIGAAVPLFLAVASLGFCFPNSTSAAMHAVDEHAGSASALVGTIQFGLAGVSSYLSGELFDGTARPLAAVIGGCGVAALLALAIVPRVHRAEAGAHPG